MLGAGLIAAAPARADHDDGPNVGFHCFFGLPWPPIPVIVLPAPPPPPPQVYYVEPAPRAVYIGRPHYRGWRHAQRYYRDHDDDRYERRGRGHWHHHDDDQDEQ